MSGMPYTKEQIDYLRKHYYDTPKETILEYFNNQRSWKSIKSVCALHKIRRAPRDHYKEEDVNWLRENYYDTPKEDILKHFEYKQSWTRIQRCCAKYKIRRKKDGEIQSRIKDPLDIIGKKYWMLTCKEYIGMKQIFDSQSKEHVYLCDCDCGNKGIEIGRSRLLGGYKKSCGCLHALKAEKRRIDPTERKINRLYAVYRLDASKRGYEFLLTKEEFKNLVSQPCHYCGESPLNGIDRIDNKLGYISTNVVPCCKTCNFLKSDRIVNTFYEWVSKVNKRKTKRNVVGTIKITNLVTNAYNILKLLIR